MLLGGDHATGLLGAGNHQTLIERFDRMHVDDLSIDAVGSERLGSSECLSDHETARDDRDIRALPYNNTAADLDS